MNFEKSETIIEKLIFICVICAYVCSMLNTTVLNNIKNSSMFAFLLLNIPAILIVLIVIRTYLSVKKTVIDKSYTNAKDIIFQLLPAFAVIGFVIICNIHENISGDINSALIVTASIALMGHDYKKILRRLCQAGMVVVGIMFTLSMLGIVNNLRGNSFGFIYRTDYAATLLYLMIMYCMYYGPKNIPLAGKIGILGITVINFIFIGGKTSYICMGLIVIVTYLSSYLYKKGLNHNNEERLGTKFDFGKYSKLAFCKGLAVINRFNEFSFIIYSLIIIGLTFLYSIIPPEFFTKIPKIATVRARFVLGIVAFKNLPINLFGHYIGQIGGGGTESYSPFYYFLDSSYLVLLLQKGLIIFAVIIGLLTFLQIRLYRNKMFYELFLVSIIALDCTMEHHIMDIAYNAVAILAFSNIYKNDREQELKPLFIHKLKHIRNKAASTALAIVLILALPWFIYTSYEMSNWVGWTPINNAAVVLTGSQLNGLQNRTDEALKYVIRHDDSILIICGKNDQENEEILKSFSNNIRAEKVVLLTADNVEGAIKESRDYLYRINSDKRLTVCAFGMQQERIRRLAKRHEIPVNSLEVNVPGYLYIQNYLLEQIRLSKVVFEDFIKG